MYKQCVNGAFCPLYSAHMSCYSSRAGKKKKKKTDGRKRKRGFGNADPNPHSIEQK